MAIKKQNILEETNNSEKSKKASSPQKFKKQKHFFLVVGIVSALVILILFLSIMGVGAYKKQWSGSFTQKITKIFSFPVVVMKGENISQDYFIMRVNSQKHYYKSQKQLDLDQIEKTEELQGLKEKTINTLIKETFIRYVLNQHKISVAQKEIDQEFANSSAGKSQEQVEAKVQMLYGWTIEEFKQELIKPYLEKQKLQKIIIFDKEVNKEQIKKAESILEELKQGVDFAELANTYSEDPGNYPEKGGDLGWITKGQMVEEFEQAVFALKPRQLSDVVATKFGFHIIKLEEKQLNKFYVRHILIKPYNFNKWLEQEIGKISIWKMNLGLVNK